MKRIVSVVGLFLLLNACASQVDGSSQSTNNTKANAANCPKTAVVSLPVPGEQEGFYDRFDFHIRNIEADENTLKFQTTKQDFVFCRGNNTWTVQPGTINSDSVPQNPYDLNFKTIDFQGKKYQYRVTIPNLSTGELPPGTTPKEPDKVVFELITPDSKEPQQQTLYTLKQLQDLAVKNGYSSLGNNLGVPRITSAIIHGNRLWWSVAFEQGEGNTGIATIVSYDPQTDKFSLIQPEELSQQQITDLAIAGDVNNPTFLMGTQISGEGNPYLPSKGLVVYRPSPENPNTGTFKSYTVDNSPLVGAIPDKLRLEDDTLWVGTANGVCQVKWEAADNPESWNCWRFAAMANLPSEGVPLYSAVTNKTPAATLSPSSGETTEVLWWSPVNFQTRNGRYEVRYSEGFTATLNEEATLADSQYQKILPPGKVPVLWPGLEWHWNGDRFVRGFDEVNLNLVGLGPSGIGSGLVDPNAPPNFNAIRGDLELLNLSPKSTSVKYYSGWVDQGKLNPYLTVVPQERPQNPQPNPLEAIAKQLKSR